MECSKRAFVHSRVTSGPTRSTQSTHTLTHTCRQRVPSRRQRSELLLSTSMRSNLKLTMKLSAQLTCDKSAQSAEHRAQSTSSTKLRKTKRRLHLHRKICRNITKLINNTTAAEATTATPTTTTPTTATTAIEMPNCWAESVHSRRNSLTRFAISL